MLCFALFDLDDTLYAAETGLWPAIGRRIELFMVERLGLAAESVPALRRRYYETFGTTLNGLRAEHQVDAHDFLAYVHDLPLDEFVRPNPALDQMLARLPLVKVVFTNADAAHARRVLGQLGIARHFDRIVDIHARDFASKPAPAAYEAALRLIGADPRACAYVEDLARNLAPAHALGMLTVLVSPQAPALSAGVDLVIPDILALEAALASTGRLPAPSAREAV
ncbi:MAG: pyrimidine 5'-nucleotidase [Anaerolineales bacterium]|nr:pyrimidine 5'-nucleotidase [Anaerolineales bacterium]